LVGVAVRSSWKGSEVGLSKIIILMKGKRGIVFIHWNNENVERIKSLAFKVVKLLLMGGKWES
jgi:hypothetical protein